MIELLPQRFVEANSAEVDGIAGATVTSDALKLYLSKQSMKIMALQVNWPK